MPPRASSVAEFIIRHMSSSAPDGQDVKRSQQVFCGQARFALAVYPLGFRDRAPKHLSALVEIAVPAEADDQWRSDNFGFQITLCNWKGRTPIFREKGAFTFSKRENNRGWGKLCAIDDLHVADQGGVREEDGAVKLQFQVWEASV